MKLNPELKPRTGETQIAWMYRVMRDDSFMNKHVDEVVKQMHKKGVAVWRADRKGIYCLNADGTRKYVKTY